jgi:hypothetical protein
MSFYSEIIGVLGRSDVEIGLATPEFRKHGNARRATELAAEGADTIQLFLSQTDSTYRTNPL